MQPNTHPLTPIQLESITTLRLLRLEEVEKIVGLKKSKIYNLIKDGLFPPPVRLGKRTSRWNSNAISRWVYDISTQQETA